MDQGRCIWAGQSKTALASAVVSLLAATVLCRCTILEVLEVVSLLAATVAATVRCRCTMLEVLEVVSLLARNLTVQYTSQKLDIVQVVEVVSLLAATVHTVCIILLRNIH